jgi:hypothetical protein
MTFKRSVVVLCVASAGLVACGEEDKAWTVRQAESIDEVRGMTVRVRQCRGIGAARSDEEPDRYERLRCVAGARRPSESFDSVAVLYEIRPTSASDYELRNVRFIGGPGIP